MNIIKTLDVARMPEQTRWLVYVGAFAWLAGIEVLLPGISIGQYVIGLYGLWAIATGVKSVESFRMAILAFVVIILSSIAGLSELAEKFAVYAFILLVIGLVCSIREEWRSNKKPETPVQKHLQELDLRSQRRMDEHAPLTNNKLDKLQHKHDRGGLRDLRMHDTISRSGDKKVPRLRRGIQ